MKRFLLARRLLATGQLSHRAVYRYLLDEGWSTDRIEKFLRQR